MKPTFKSKPRFNCDKDASIMVISAFRYVLNKSANATHVQEWISNNWNDLDRNTQIVIVQDAFDHVMNQKNNEQWKKFVIPLYQRLDPNARKTIDYQFHSTKEKKNWFDAHLKPILSKD